MTSPQWAAAVEAAQEAINAPRIHVDGVRHDRNMDAELCLAAARPHLSAYFRAQHAEELEQTADEMRLAEARDALDFAARVLREKTGEAQ